MSAENHLTKEQQKKLSEWLSSRIPNGLTCSACGHKEWTAASDLVTTIKLVGNNLSLGGNIYPMAMLICRNCANTLFFNAVLTGAMDQEEETDAAL